MRLTQEELASRAGLGRTTVTNLEAGRQHVPLDELLSIAEALSVELRELVPLRSAFEERVRVFLGDQPTSRAPRVVNLLGKLKGGQRP